MPLPRPGAAVLLLGVTAALLLPTPVSRAEEPADEATDPYGTILTEFRKKVASRDLLRAAEAVELLDPAEPRSLPEYLALLDNRHWRLRGAAFEAVSKVPAGPLRSEVRLHLLTHGSEWVREGLAYALLLAPLEGDGDALVGALDDDRWRVRRTVARGLGRIVSAEGVGRLVQALEEEQDLRVLVWVRDSLRGIVGRNLGRDPSVWRQWWERHKDRPEWKRHGEEETREEFAGVPLQTFTVEAPPVSPEDRARREKLPDLFVLNPFGYDHGYFRPYLDEAAEFLRIHYVTLPTVQEVTGKSGFGRSVPRYPVDRLAKALDALRKERGREKVVVMGAGPVGWIAETYALRYPEHTAGIVVLNGWLDSKSYSGALARLSAGGTPAERWAADILRHVIERTHDERESVHLRLALFTHGFADRRDSEAYRIMVESSLENGFATVPDLAFDRHTRIHTPTLFLFPDPELSPLSGGTTGDLRRIRDSFRKPPPVTAVLRETRGMAHVEDPREVLRILRGFLVHAGILETPR